MAKRRIANVAISTLALASIVSPAIAAKPGEVFGRSEAEPWDERNRPKISRLANRYQASAASIGPFQTTNLSVPVDAPDTRVRFTGSTSPNCSLPREIASIEPSSRGESIRIWRLDALTGVELLVALHSARAWRVFHESYEICLIPDCAHNRRNLAGWRYRGRDYMYRAATAGVMEPGELHVSTRVLASADFWSVMISPKVLAAAANELGLPGPPHFRVGQSDSPRVVAALERFYDSVAHGSTPLEQQTRFAAAIGTLLDVCGERRPKAPPRVHPGVQRAREYLHAHVADPVSLTDLATVSGLSSYRLAHVFAQTIGLPPHAYLNALRVARARRQLRAGVPPSLIESGFADQSHLIRQFRRGVGVTPGVYITGAALSLLPRFPCDGSRIVGGRSGELHPLSVPPRTV